MFLPTHLNESVKRERLVTPNLDFAWQEMNNRPNISRPPPASGLPPSSSDASYRPLPRPPSQFLPSPHGPVSSSGHPHLRHAPSTDGRGYPPPPPPWYQYADCPSGSIPSQYSATLPQSTPYSSYQLPSVPCQPHSRQPPVHPPETQYIGDAWPRAHQHGLHYQYPGTVPRPASDGSQLPSHSPNPILDQDLLAGPSQASTDVAVGTSSFRRLAPKPVNLPPPEPPLRSKRASKSRFCRCNLCRINPEGGLMISAASFYDHARNYGYPDGENPIKSRRQKPSVARSIAPLTQDPPIVSAASDSGGPSLMDEHISIQASDPSSAGGSTAVPCTNPTQSSRRNPQSPNVIDLNSPSPEPHLASSFPGDMDWTDSHEGRIGSPPPHNAGTDEGHSEVSSLDLDALADEYDLDSPDEDAPVNPNGQVPSFDDSENTDNLENLDHPSDSTDDEEVIGLTHPVGPGYFESYLRDPDSHSDQSSDSEAEENLGNIPRLLPESTALGSSDSPEDEIDQISAMLLDIKFEYKVSDAVMKALFRGIGLYSGQIIPKMKSYEHSIAQLEGMSKQNITFFKTCERGCVVHSRTKRTCTACQHRDTVRKRKNVPEQVAAPSRNTRRRIRPLINNGPTPSHPSPHLRSSQNSGSSQPIPPNNNSTVGHMPPDSPDETIANAGSIAPHPAIEEVHIPESGSVLQSTELADPARQHERREPKFGKYAYFHLIPRLQEMFLHPEAVDELMYRANRRPTPDVQSDIFDGKHYKYLRKRKFFSRPTDIALGLTLDGFQISKRNGRQSRVFAIINYNLRPEIRMKEENLIKVGITPGLSSPKDLESFLEPLYEELSQLERGVESVILRLDGVYEKFTLNAHVICCTGDLPAIAKISMMSGHTAKSGCRFCHIKGRYCRGIYYYEETLPSRRTKRSFKRTWSRLSRANSKKRKEIITTTGINGCPGLCRLKTIDPSVCFPIDLMHLMARISYIMVSIWIGETTIPKASTLNQVDMKAKLQHADRLMGNIDIPTGFGPMPRPIFSDWKTYKTEEWQNWIIAYSMPLLHSVGVPEVHIQGWGYFVDAVRLLLLKSLDQNQRTMISILLTKFYKYYTRTLACLPESLSPASPGSEADNSGLKLMKMYIHLLLHIPLCIQYFGPMYSYWQFPMERLGGSIMRSIKSRSKPIENLARQQIVREALRGIEKFNTKRPYFAVKSVALQLTKRHEQRESSEAASQNGAPKHSLTGRKEISRLSETEMCKLKAAYLKTLIWGSGPTPLSSLESFNDSWIAASPTITIYHTFQHNTMEMHRFCHDRPNGRRSNCWVKVLFSSPQTTREGQIHPLRYYRVAFFFTHTFCGITSYWVCCAVPKSVPANRGYDRHPVARTFRFDGFDATQAKRIFIPLHEIDSAVGVLCVGEVIYILDKGDMSVYITPWTLPAAGR